MKEFIQLHKQTNDVTSTDEKMFYHLKRETK